MTRLTLLPALGLALGLLSAPAPAPESAGFARAVALAERALDQGDLDTARAQVQRALERDPKSIQAWELRGRWAEATSDRDELVYALHRRLQLMSAQGAEEDAQDALRERLFEIDPVAEDLLDLSTSFIEKLLPIAEKYEADGRPHSAIRVLKEILALDPERLATREAIERIASAPDPSLAADAKPKDLLADVSDEWIREFDARHATWDTKAKLERDNYFTYTDAGYEVLVRTGEAMEQMNAFYRVFFEYGTEEHGGSVPRIDINIFKNRDEYLSLGIGPPVEWSGGHFTGGAVETYIGSSGFEGMAGTLFHEAAHQFVSLATSAVGWLNEGLASFFEGTRILSNGTVIMNLPANHRLFPLVTRMERGWMADAWDGADRNDPSGSTPEKAPTFGIVLANEYPWGPAWYAPTWGVVYFLYNFEDPVDGRFIYRDGFREFIDKSGGRSGEGAIENFEELVLGNPKAPTKGVDFETREGSLTLPTTVAELDPVWKDWLTRLRDEQSGRIEVERPYHQWALYAEKRGDWDDAYDHYEKGQLAAPENARLLYDFAALLKERFANPDRASKLLVRAARVVESQQPLDQELLTEIDRLLSKCDPKRKTLQRVHASLIASVEGIVQSYMAEDLDMMAMDVSWRFGNEFEVPALFTYFEEAMRRAGKTLSLWKLAYNEENLDGWASAGNENFTADGEIIRATYGDYAPEDFSYRFLTLDTVTSGDFSFEAEVLADRGQVGFCGLVFGRKSATDFHALILFPPGQEDGQEKAGYLDLATFHSPAFETWRHLPVLRKERDDRSVSEEWRKLRIDVTGRTIDVWFDDEYVTTQEFASVDVLRGQFGLMLSTGKARYRNVRYLARAPRDPGSRIERELRMESVAGEGESLNGSWLGMVPPWPKAKKWLQGERESWQDAGPVPQIILLWSIDQNDSIPLHDWLSMLDRTYAPYGLKIVSICSAWDAERLPSYLVDHPFPGSVALDSLENDEGIGRTYKDYAIDRFFMPRLLLLDIDQKVIWEGDPGFKAGRAYDPELVSYLRAPLDDLIARRKLEALARWRTAWTLKARKAIARGEFERGAKTLLESREYDWRVDEDVFEAHARLTAIEAAVGDLEGTAAALVERGAEPAIGTLLEWAALLELELDPKTEKAVKKHARSGHASGWKKALGALSPLRKKIDAGKELGSIDKVLEKLERFQGPIPALLRERLVAAGDNEALLVQVVFLAEALPGEWLAREHFGWSE
jgi:tetratricopeptide (TPR) repeat protein